MNFLGAFGAILREVPQRFHYLQPWAAYFEALALNHLCLSRRTQSKLAELYHLNMRGRTQIISLRDGFKMEVTDEDVIQGRIMLYGSYRRHVWEPITARLICRLARESRNILVAGGHVGYFPLLTASVVKRRSGQVITFEPNDVQRGQLSRNVRLNGFTNITVEKYALFNKSGETLDFFSDSITNVCSTIIATRADAVGRHVPVETVTIDDYWADRGGLDLIVLDIEGAEPEALSGASGLLNLGRESAPDLIFEIVPGRRSAGVQDRMLSEICGNGYEMFMIDDSYDYVVADESLTRPVRMVPVFKPDVATVARIQRALNLKDPNIYATKKGVSRLEDIVILDDVNAAAAESESLSVSAP